MMRSRFLLLSLPVLCWGLIFYLPVFDMVSVWSQSKTYEHGFLIVPISLWVAWQQRDAARCQPKEIAWFPILLVPIPGLLWLIGYAANIALFEHTAAIMSFQLLLWTLLGTPRARVMWFPIAYLLFCIPFGEELIPLLQEFTADLSILFLNLAGVPVYRDGLYISIPNGRFFVAEACSGIRFLISSVALGCLFAYLQFQKTGKRILFVIFSFVFPIIANGIRAFGIILVGYLTDMKHATGADHLIYGWVFFSLVILGIFLTASLFADPPPTTVQHRKPEASCNHSPERAIGLLCALLLCFALWGQSIMHNQQAVSDTTPLLSGSIPTQPASYWGINFPNAAMSQQGTDSKGTTFFYTARYPLWQENGELISSNNQLYDKERWSQKKTSQLQLTKNANANFITLTNNQGTGLQLIYWYCIRDYCNSNPLLIKLTQARQLMLGDTGFANVYAIASTNKDSAERYAKQWQEHHIKQSLQP